MTDLRVTAPRPFEVLQRRGDAAMVRVSVEADAEVSRLDVRTVARGDAFGSPTPWTRVDAQRCDGVWSGVASLAAGGWFQLDVRAFHGDSVVAEGQVSPIGVGEVFLVAGQSYVCGAHERKFTVQDAAGRVSTTGPEEAGWRVAHDPPPAIFERMDEPTRAFLAALVASADPSLLGDDSPHRGSVWPLVGDALLAAARVPVGFVHAGLGATTIAQWQKPGRLYENLLDAARLAGDWRAVLWALGESDAQLGTPRAAFVAGMRRLREDFSADTGSDAPWVVARSTIHPSSGSNPANEALISAAVDDLWASDGFVAGPDTDALDGMGVHRAAIERGGHFTELGQRRAAALWVEALKPLL